jgi:hypothetical protein
MLNQKWTLRNGTRIYKYANPSTIDEFNHIVEGCMGHAFSYPLRIQSQNHYLDDSFEIGLPSLDCEEILQFW